MKNNYTTPRINYNQVLISLFFILFISFSGHSQSATCASPPSLNVNNSCINTGYSLPNNSTVATPPATCGANTNWESDGYYTFTTPAGVTQISITGTSNAQLGLALYQGDCTTFASNLITCTSPATSGASLTNVAVTPSTQYILRIARTDGPVSGNNSMSGNICIVNTTPPCNPPNITAISNVTGTTATINWNAATPAPANGYQWEVRTSGAGGSGPTGLVASGSVGPGITSANITGLSPSTTYTRYVRSDCGGGNFSTWDGPNSFTTQIAGNFPCEAIPLSNNSCTTQDNTGSTNSGITAPSGCPTTAGYSGNDIWFVTNADANGNLEIETNHLSGSIHDDTVVAFYTGTCGSLTFISCDDDDQFNEADTVGIFESYETLTGLAPNETVYIREWNFNSTSGEGAFEICLSTPPAPPGNDDCSNATPLPCGTSNLAGTTNGTTLLNPGTTCTVSNYGVWYTFTGAAGFRYNIRVDPLDSGFDVELAISQGTCAALTNPICVDDNGAGSAESTGIITQNTVYYVYVASTFAGAGPFDTGDFEISLTCDPIVPPPNDDPCGAEDLVINDSCVTTLGTTFDATDSTTSIPAVSDPSCTGYNGGDVWYTVTVPPSFGAEFTISTQAGVATDTGMAVYSYTGSCPSSLSFTELACENDAGMTAITLNNASNGILPGDVLYVRVWETNNDNQGSFSICATANVPAGNGVGVSICAGSTSLPMTSDLFCNAAGFNPAPPFSGTLDTGDPQANRLTIWIESDDPCSFNSGSPNYYYEEIDFTVTTTGTYVFDFNGNFDSMGYIVVNDGNFNPGSCASGTYIAGDDASGSGGFFPWHSQITATLTAGVSYTLITTHFSSFISLPQNYSWTVNVLPTSAEWFTQSSGGTPVGYGAFFDPIGDPDVIAMGGAYANLTDTNTPGAYDFWVACPNTSGARIPVTYTITPGPISATATGTATGCGTFEVTVNVNEPGGTSWDISYLINNNPATETYAGTINTNPGVVTVNEPANTNINIRVYNSTTFCYVDVPGTIIVGAGGKVWDINAASQDWFNPNNWTPVGVPTSSDCVVIPDTSSGGGIDPEIPGTGNGDAASITVQNGGVLTILPGGTVTVQDEVNVAAGGSFLLQGSQQDSAQLIQVNNAVNSGNITLVRETNVRSQDYVYWSSPVESFAVTAVAPFTPNWLIYEWIPTLNTNPGEHGYWSNTTENMMAGKGYAVRGPANAPGTNDTTATWNTATFIGVPHNGTYTTNIQRGGFAGPTILNGPGVEDNITDEEDNWNLVGNPYPSALDAVDFLTTNTNIEGTVYLWTHGTRIQQGVGSPFYGNYVYNYNQADYLEYNSSGGTQMGFQGFIGSGQGFYILMNDPSDTTPASGNVTFDNTMRDRTHNNGQFFRNANPSNSGELERHRIWLDLVEPSGNTNTTLVAYVEGATMEKDRLFDAKTIGGNGKNIYSMLGETPLIIQGRSLPFDNSDQVPIGINVTETGLFAIAIHGIDGLFEETPQDIYIYDIETGTIHNLKEAPYFFTLDEAGEYNNRFILQYTNNSLSIDEFELTNLQITAPESSYIKINSGNQLIKNVIIYDLHGRILINKSDINSHELLINEIPQSTGTYLVKAILIDGSQKVQKIILK